MTDTIQVPDAGESVHPSRSPPGVSDNPRRHGYTCTSSSLSSSFDNPGSPDSIYNAIRVSTPYQSARCSGAAYEMGPVMEEGLAANMAMFIPIDSSHDDQPLTDNGLPRKERKKANAVWWRNVPSAQISPRPPGPSSPLADGQNVHRRAISLDATDAKRHSPSWPGKLTPAVTTAQPSYPPPERQPTPPGLPSFNTPEAVYCSAQFLVGPNGRPHHHRGLPGEGQRAASYGDTVRRFFGLSPPIEPGANTFPAVGIGRPEDGTIVQGRFPYRQSGHGTNPTRQLQDHPFHQSGFPVAESRSVGNVNGFERDLEAAKDTLTPPRPRRRVRILTPSSLRRMSATLAGNSTCAEETAVSSRSRKPARPSALLGLTQTPSRSDTPSRAAPSGAVESSVQVLGTIGDHDSSPTHVLSVLSQSISGETADEQVTAEETTTPHTVTDALCWLPSQMYVHCCPGSSSVRSSREDLEALDVIASQETYATAREYQSGSGSWFSAVCHFIRPRSLDSERSPPV